MHKSHTRTRRWLAIASTLLILTFALTFSNRFAGWASKLTTTKLSQSQENKSKIVLPAGQGDKKSTAKAGAAAQPADDDDADLPPFARGKVEKDEYLEMRQDNIDMLRGLPYPDGIPNPRVAAIRKLQQQEIGRPESALDAWVPIGPAPIPNGQTSPVVPVSGRVTSIDVHPTNPNIVYVGTAQGGVYRSLNGGATWTPLMDNALSLAIGAVTINPSNPSMVFVGTGEANFSADSYFGVGVYIIQNADTANPTLVGPLNKDAGNADVMTGRAISRILVHPTDANTIFVATTSGTSGNPSSTVGLTVPSAGLYRSTNALSANPTFTRLAVPTGAGITTRSIPDAAFEPGNPNNVLCTVLGATAAALDGGIWRSTNALDPTPANVTFTQRLQLGSNIRADMAINKVGSTVTVIAATGESSTGRVRRSVDGGVTWPAAIGGGSNGFCGGQCFYDNEPGIHPNDANIVLLGGATTFLRSTNATQTPPTFTSSGASLHADHHAIAFAPSDPTIVYEGNDGGIYKSMDTGATWTSLNNSGFSATQFQSLALHPRDRNFSFGGTQDNGTEFYRPDGSWIRADFGDGGYAAIDQSAYDNTTVTAYHTYFNQTNNVIGFGRIKNVANAQENGWSFLGVGGTANGIGNDPTVLFYAPLALGPGTPNTLYFGTDRLYRSTNEGTQMTVVSQGPIVSGAAIDSIAISPQNDNVRIVGLRNGRVFATTTGATTLTEVTSASFPSPVRAIGRVAIDPTNSNTAYVTFLGFGVAAGQHIWKTTNLSGGTVTWAAAGNGIPDVPVSSFVIDPKNPSNLYAGTDIGVYQSTDGGANWIPYGTALPRVAVFDLAIQSPNRILRAATHGRGIFEISLPGVATPLATLEAQPVIATPVIDNGNGVFDPGEDGTITIPLKNVGQATATGITGTLTTSTPGVTILVGTSAYPNIAVGGTQNNATQFVFRISPTFLCGSKINFTLTFAYNDPASPRTFNFSLTTGVGGSTPTTFTYSGAPVAIPDNSNTGITVPVNFSGLTSAVSSVKFTIGGSSCNTTVGSTTVGIDHTYIGDLAIFLVSPAGTAIQLTPINGNNAGINMCQTVFDDTAANAFANVTTAQNPFTGSFRPLQPLSTFAGENGNGQWSVVIFDLGPGDTGSLRAFSLELKTAVCAKANSLTTIASSANPSIVGQPVTLTATVAPAGVATGTVQFKDNGVALGAPVALAANGTASITTSALTQGIHPITAEYSGDANFNPSTGSLTQIVDRLAVSLADPAVCTGPGGVVAVTASVTNSGNANVAIAFTATLPAQLLALPGTCTATVGTCTVVNASTVTVAATLTPGQTTTINYQTQIADGTPTGTQMCVNSAVSFGGNPAATVQACTTANCPTVGPGLPLGTTSPLNDQKAGSVLIYNVYTSATDPTRQNTRLSITNTSPTRSISVHLFFVDGSSCSTADSYLCLTANQTVSFLASDLDPGTSGYVVAVATDSAGCPVNFNFLIGDEYVKFATGHAANLAAESITAIAGGLPLCNTNSTTSTLAFDGISYNVVPRVLALDNVGSKADGNDTLLILNRIGGNLATGASTLGTVFGILYDDSESGLSFSVTGSCQLRNSLSNTFPRTTPRFESFIPAGRSGWLKVFSQSDIGISGAAINFNPNAETTAGAFNQGHNLHVLTNTAAASYTIPVFPPGC